MWRGRLARGRGSVPLPRAGRMPARQRAGRPRHDFQSSRSCSSADERPETMKMREAPWSAAARRRLCMAPTEFLVRRALNGTTGASCNSSSRDNSKAASSRRTPGCLRHTDFQSRKRDWSWTLGGNRKLQVWDHEPIVIRQSTIVNREFYRARVNTSCNSSRVRLMGLPLVLLAWEAFSTRVGTSLSAMP